MKKNQIIILAAVVLILAGITALVFLQEQKTVSSEETIPSGAEENFYSYLELPSLSGKFLGFDEAKSKIYIVYFDTETVDVSVITFKVDKQTIFSKVTLDPYQPDLFPKGDLQMARQETPITVFYLSVESGFLARLVQVEAPF